jgi:hypothetical protein
VTSLDDKRSSTAVRLLCCPVAGLMSCNADAQRFAVSRGDRTQIRVDDDR